MNKNNNLKDLSFYNELRQIRKEDNKVIYYQLLEKVIEERKQVPKTIEDFELDEKKREVMKFRKEYGDYDDFIRKV